MAKAMGMLLLNTRKCFTHAVSKYIMGYGCKMRDLCSNTVFNSPFMFNIVIFFAR